MGQRLSLAVLVLLLTGMTALADDIPRVADFPDGPLAAEVGQFVFAPTRDSLDETKADPEYRAPRYMQAEVLAVGPLTSTLRFDVGEAVIPNAYMIPLPRAEVVVPGDVVLASRYGNSMEVAVVTKGGPAP